MRKKPDVQGDVSFLTRRLQAWINDQGSRLGFHVATTIFSGGVVVVVVVVVVRPAGGY